MRSYVNLWWRLKSVNEILPLRSWVGETYSRRTVRTELGRRRVHVNRLLASRELDGAGALPPSLMLGRAPCSLAVVVGMIGLGVLFIVAGMGRAGLGGGATWTPRSDARLPFLEDAWLAERADTPSRGMAEGVRLRLRLASSTKARGDAPTGPRSTTHDVAVLVACIDRGTRESPYRPTITVRRS